MRCAGGTLSEDAVGIDQGVAVLAKLGRIIKGPGLKAVYG